MPEPAASVTTDPRRDWSLIGIKPTPATEPTPPPVVPLLHAAGGDAYAQAALARECEAVTSQREPGRNDRLNVAAFNLGQLVGSGQLAQEVVSEALYAAGRASGLEAKETADTVRSGLTKGRQHPREVKPLAVITADVEEVSLAALAPSLSGNPAAAPPGDTAEATRPERTTWWPALLAERAAAAAEQVEPTTLCRDDGRSLFYSGKVNGLIGESESGKSWVLFWALAQAVQAGRRCLLLDFEDSAGGIHQRMKALGCTDDELGRLWYANPDEALGIAQAADLGEALAEGFDVIGFDGVNAAMTLLGYDINSNTDATKFNRRVLKPLAATGAAVVTVDHLPKNAEQRGKGGIGAQAKRAMMDGCCLSVEVVEPFGKGQDGILKLKVDKDRPGAVRGVSAGSVLAGKVYVFSQGEAITIQVAAPDLRPAEERPAWEPWHQMEAVSRLLEDAPEPLSGRTIEAAVRGKADVIRLARGLLVAQGFVQVSHGARGAELHHSVRPYRHTDDGDDEPVRPARPSASPPRPGRGQTSASRPPLPLRGGDALKPHSRHGEKAEDEDALGSACNRCGETVPDRIIEQFGGYCSACGRVVNQ